MTLRQVQLSLNGAVTDGLETLHLIAVLAMHVLVGVWLLEQQSI